MRKEFILFATTAMLLSGPCWPVEPAETIPQQGASHPSASAIPDYVRAIQKRIRPVTNALVTEGDKSIEAVFPVEIDAEGNVLSIAVTTSSGDSKYDSAYMEAIRKVGMPRPT